MHDEENAHKKLRLSDAIAMLIFGCICEGLIFAFDPYYYTCDEINKDNMNEVYRSIIAIVCHNYRWVAHIMTALSLCAIALIAYNRIKKKPEMKIKK